MTNRQCNYIINTISIIGMIIVLIFLFSSCKTKTVYVPVESVKTEYKDKLMRDSIYLHDSIITTIKGDTIWFEKYKYLYRDKLVHDSIFITDSIQVPYPVIETKEVNKLKWYQEILIYLGLLCVGILGYRVYRLVK